MPIPAAIAQARLLARAQRGMECPASLDDAARQALIAELADAQNLLAGPQSPLLTGHDATLETGSYCVLSTAHLCVATADLLDHWCSGQAQDRVLNIASCIYGWFIPTREVDELTRGQLPADLLAVMQFGRVRGFDHILFDCDAGTVEGLAVHSW